VFIRKPDGIRFSLGLVVCTSEFRSDDDEFVGNDAPASPAGQTVLPMIQTAAQATSAFEAPDAPFDAHPKTQGSFEPGLLFIGLAALRLSARLGQSDVFDAQGADPSFIFN
jgi:hypothetical protein